MKKILCVDARMLSSSGIGTYLKNLLPRIEPFFDLKALLNKDDLPLFKMISNGHPVEVKAPIYSLTEQVALYRQIPFCDLFWSPHYNVPLLPIRARKKIVTLHDVCHLALPHFPKYKKLLAKLLMSQAMKLSDAVITVSSFSKREITSYFSEHESKINVILNGVNPLNPFQTKQLRETPFILYVGNFKAHKNLERLIQAFLLLPEPLDLILIGGPKFKSPSPRVKILDSITDDQLPFYYANARMFVQPSLYEGFGLTPLEAMACGCPVVSSSFASLPEVCGEAAYYINPLEVESIVLGMSEVLSNDLLRARLIAAGYKRIEAFSWDIAAEKTVSLFQQILS